MKRVMAAFAGAVLAVVLAGCAPGEARVELPADPPKGTVQSFGEQKPSWRGCLDGVQCADVRAPLDWEDPAGKTITLRLVKRQATGKNPIGTLFVNPGGPGASGADYVAEGLSISDEVLRDYDVIGWDPRGVGKSSAVTCLDAAGMDDFLFGVGPLDDLEPGSDAWIKAAQNEERAFAKQCQKNTGPLLGNVSTAETVQDLDMLRAIVGDKKLNYLGFSYGTYIGARYADAYPQNVGRLVLDGALDPAVGMGEVVREQTRGFEAALRAYATDCVAREDCPLGGSVDGAMSQIRAQLDSLEAQPLRGSDKRLLTASTMLTAIITPLYSQDMWGYLDDLFASVANADADMGLSLADFYYDRQDGKYLSNSTEAFTAINCLDYPVVKLDPARMAQEAAELEQIAPTIGRFQGYGDVGCSAWPYPGVAERSGVTAAGADPILVVGTTGDPATPYRWAESLAAQLESGVLLSYVGEGHTAYGKNSCVNKKVDDYLLSGTVPDPADRCS